MLLCISEKGGISRDMRLVILGIRNMRFYLFLLFIYLS